MVSSNGCYSPRNDCGMFDYPDGATPVDAEEAEGLIPGHITTRAELNEWEQANIAQAALWVRGTTADPFLPETVTGLHRRMFDKTWDWAGRFRDSGKTIGVPKDQIGEELKKLLDDGRYWLNEGTYQLREAALRMHHRMVWVHPFPNGNGRHARLWVDLVVQRAGGTPIQWGRGLGSDGGARTQYIAALKAADRGDYGPLLELYLEDAT
jgi:Fic-DOC domain mobile mystery protein B